MVINTVLSIMSYNYPFEKLSVCISDDGGSKLTFYALIRIEIRCNIIGIAPNAIAMNG